MCELTVSQTCAAVGFLIVFTATECERLSSNLCTGTPSTLYGTVDDPSLPPGCIWDSQADRLYLNTRWNSTEQCSSKYECLCCDPSQNTNSEKCETWSPTAAPSQTPSAAPRTPAPTAAPTLPPLTPTAGPTRPPSVRPSVGPTAMPSVAPTTSEPSAAPTLLPSVSPSAPPTVPPTTSPSRRPSTPPTALPSAAPTAAPSAVPSGPPSAAPTSPPSAAPSGSPTAPPSGVPSAAPSALPSTGPSLPPTTAPTTGAPSASPTQSKPPPEPPPPPPPSPQPPPPPPPPSATCPVCTAKDQCHEKGVCEASLLLCSDPRKPDGTSCDDGDAATKLDECVRGDCQGHLACFGLDCVAADPHCHVSECDSAARKCVDAVKPDGESCDDEDAQTVSDRCVAGVCRGTVPTPPPAPSPPPFPPPPPPPAPSALEDAAPAVSKAAVSIAAATGPAGAGTPVIMKLGECKVEDLDLDPEPLDWELHPVGVFLDGGGIGDNEHKYFAGAVVWNLGLVLVPLAALVALAYARTVFLEEEFRCSLSRMRAPGFALAPFVFLVMGISLSASHLAFFSQRAPAVCGVLGWVVLLGVSATPLLLWQFMLRKGRFHAKMIGDPRLAETESQMGPTALAVYRFFFGDRVWVSADEDPYFVQCHGICFEGYKEDMQWFLVPDIGHSVVIAFFPNWTAGQRWECTLRNSMVFVVLAAYLAAVLIQRPFTSPFESVAVLVLATCNALAVLLMTVALAIGESAPTGLWAVAIVLLAIAAVAQFTILFFTLMQYINNTTAQKRRQAWQLALRGLENSYAQHVIGFSKALGAKALEKSDVLVRKIEGKIEAKIEAHRAGSGSAPSSDEESLLSYPDAALPLESEPQGPSPAQQYVLVYNSQCDDLSPGRSARREARPPPPAEARPRSPQHPLRSPGARVPLRSSARTRDILSLTMQSDRRIQGKLSDSSVVIPPARRAQSMSVAEGLTPSRSGSLRKVAVPTRDRVGGRGLHPNSPTLAHRTRWSQQLPAPPVRTSSVLSEH
eukprot:TRINITY_DN1024_c3_g1_i1.p1 TRINITY_DN1024_c3_g1~~TRINITY_DN1024_c3_g1_i1.p1  ORF type:complete len:1020 (+),score=299.81 TRINITY_DN1024_c3_g1_i1:35-3094(+)